MNVNKIVWEVILWISSVPQYLDMYNNNTMGSAPNKS